MIILVEGPDGTGKTTLCEEFKKKGFEYIHLGKEREVNLLYDKLIKYLQANKAYKNIVIDRAYISNIIYSNVYKDSNYISLENLSKIHSLIDLIILTIPKDKEKYLNHFYKLKNTRKELYSSMEKVYDLYLNRNSYNFLLQDKPYIIYDMFSDSLKSLQQKMSEGDFENVN